MAQAATAFLIAASQLRTNGKTLLATVAPSFPHGSTVFPTLRCRLHTDQTPKALPCKVFLLGIDLRSAAAIRNSPPLQIPGIQQNLIPAAALAAPDGVAVFALIRGIYNGQLAHDAARVDFAFRFGF